MPDVLIVADTIRSPELRHEVPLAVPDPFIYVEREGVKHMVAASMELVRLPAVAPEIVAHPLEELGSDELYARGLAIEEIQLELVLRACRELGVEAAVVPATFPLRDADFLRGKGIELTVDQAFFDGAQALEERRRRSRGSGARSARPRPGWPPGSTCCAAPSRTARPRRRRRAADVRADQAPCRARVRRARRCRRGVHRLARRADGRRPRHGLGADRSRATSSSSTSSRATASRGASPT